MKSSFNAFLSLHKVTQRARVARLPLTCRQKVPGVQGKVGSVLARLARLNVGPESTVGGEDESKRRVILFECVSSVDCGRVSVLIYRRTLEGIKDELRPISERSSTVSYQENDADGRTVCELAEDLRDAIIEYQVGHDPQPCTGHFAKAAHSSLNKRRCTSKIVD